MTTEPCCPSRELPLRTQLVVFSVSRGARRLSLLKSWRQGRVGPRFRLGAAEAGLPRIHRCWAATTLRRNRYRAGFAVDFLFIGDNEINKLLFRSL